MILPEGKPDCQTSDETITIEPTETTEDPATIDHSPVLCTALKVTCEEVAFAGKVLRIPLLRYNRDGTAPEPPKPRGRPRKMFKTNVTPTTTPPRLKKMLLRPKTELTKTRLRLRSRKRLVVTQSQRTATVVKKKKSTDPENIVKEIRQKMQRKRNASYAASERENGQLETADKQQTKFSEFVSPLDVKKTASLKTYSNKNVTLPKKEVVHNSQHSRVVLEFSELINNVKQVALEEAKWKVKVILVKQKISQVVFVNKRNSDRCVQFYRDADYYDVTFGEWNVSLVGAPEVRNFEDLHILMEILDDIDERDPLLECNYPV